MGEHGRGALEERVDPATRAEHVHVERIGPDQHARADQAAEQRVVRTDHGVLHDVRQQQHHDEVEGVQLRQVSLASEAEQHDQGDVHGEGAQDLVGHTHAEVDEVVPHGAHPRRSRLTTWRRR
jgi:hypothetical protein